MNRACTIVRQDAHCHEDAAVCELIVTACEEHAMDHTLLSSTSRSAAMEFHRKSFVYTSTAEDGA